MAGLRDLLERYKNYTKGIEWQLGRGDDIANQHDVNAIEDWERWQGIGPSNLGGLSSMAGAIKAYHGPPHAFERFDMSKIGSGEGAQAYGHGLYMAESPAVAQEYQKQLAADVTIGGKPFYRGKTGSKLSSTGNEELDDYLLANLGDVNATRKALLSDIRGIREEAGYTPKDYQKTLADLRQIRADVNNQGTGHFYETSLEWPDPAREAADPLSPEHFLQWDRPLSEQSDYVKSMLGNPPEVQNLIKEKMAWRQKTFNQLPEDHKLKEIIRERLNNEYSPSGADLYYEFAKRKANSFGFSNGPNSAVDSTGVLQELGIPGIRYLDQGSRGAGEGTHNYVVFDDQIPKIMQRNGMSLADLLRRK